MAAIFLMAGSFYIAHFSGTKILFLSIKGFPFPAFFLTSAITILIIGGLSIITGFRMKWGAYLLIFFLIPTTIIYHTNLISLQTGIDLLKNICIIGGLLLLSNTPPGRYSIDYVVPQKTGKKETAHSENTEGLNEIIHNNEAVIEENTENTIPLKINNDKRDNESPEKA